MARDEVATRGSAPAASALPYDAEAPVRVDLQTVERVVGNAATFWSCGDGDTRLRLAIVLRSCANTDRRFRLIDHSTEQSMPPKPTRAPSLADESAHD